MATSFKEYIKTLEFPFCYYAYVIDREGLIDYFHYGLWETDTEGLKEAQENLAVKMKSLIPTGVKRILDVGCGLGRTTYDLTVSGYDVIGISPDLRLMELAKAKHNECAHRLVISPFEDYKSPDLFDLIFFQESAQYIKELRFLFSHCKELLNESGYILMCDEIRYENSDDHSFHEKKEIVKTAHECGFKLMSNENITKKVLETRNFALRSIIENKDFIISEFSSVRENASQEIESLIEGWQRHNSMFKNNKFGYEVFLFQKYDSKSITIRLYEKGDEVGITKLFQEVFGREMTLEEWRWKYTGRGNTKAYSSVAVTQTNELVAHYGGMPQRMIFNGREIKGISIGDVMVHPKYRTLNIFRKVCALLPEETAKEAFILGYGFPNERALRLPLILGLYEKVEDVFEATKEVGFSNNVNRFIYKFFPLSFDDNRIDIFWESVKKELRIAVIRDKEYLVWRYKLHSFLKYELWGIKKRFGSSLQGLAVLRRENERLLIIDFVCTSRMMSILFQKIENYAYSIGAKKLVLWAPGYLAQSLSKMNFSIRPAGISIPRTAHEKWLTKEEIQGKFFYTMGDTDFL